MFRKKILDQEILFFTCNNNICTFFDSLFQFFNGINIIGQVSPLNYRITSFFGDEAKMGSFILKIYILLSFINLLIEINYQKIIFLITTILSIVLVVISGDRAPFFLMLIYFVTVSFALMKKQFSISFNFL